MISLDPYYSVAEYHDALDAMEFNDVSFHEYIDTRTKQWYIDLRSTPTHKYMSCKNDMYLVEKVRPLEVLDEEHIKRKPGDTSLDRYLASDCITELAMSGRSVAYAFVTTLPEVQKLSRDSQYKIWWFGKYLNGTCICACEANPKVPGKTIMVPPQVALFDIEIRKRLLEYRDFLRKYTKQPYFKGGKFYGFRGRKPFDY